MFKPISAYSGFTVDDLPQAQKFYEEILGCETEERTGGMKINLPGHNVIWAYPKDDHKPPAFTILNFVVSDIDEAVDELVARGVTFVYYEGMPIQQDEKGILRGRAAHKGPDIAWFKDPAGNTLAVLQS